MIHRPDALKHLAPHWFAIVMSLCGLALAWGRAVPMLGDIAGAGALLLAGAAALVFVALALLSLLRWQHFGDAVAAEPSVCAPPGVVVVLDRSSSMNGEIADGTTKWVAARTARIASMGCTVPPPKLWVFSTTTSAVQT